MLIANGDVHLEPQTSAISVLVPNDAFIAPFLLALRRKPAALSDSPHTTCLWTARTRGHHGAVKCCTCRRTHMGGSL